MSSDRHFYVEQRRANRWVLPEKFRSLRSGDFPLEFAWDESGGCSFQVFFGDDALFPFLEGQPSGASELCDEVTKWSGMGADWVTQMQPRWLPFTDLGIDLWSEPSVLVSGRVPARLAPQFEYGDELLPGALAGATSTILQGPIRLATSPINSTSYGAISKDRQEYLVPVTWLTSVDDLLCGRADDFHALLNIADARDLRVIALLF